MRIHCLCLVRDEADILGHTLDAALQWAHAIYVLDNGSSDGTWELLQDYAKTHSRVLLLGREYGPYRSSLWGEMANEISGKVKKRDWWCRLDADEIYVDDPRHFLARMSARSEVVYSASIQYYFTDIDLAAYERDPSEYTREWKPERLRYYRTNWSEPRFVRHTSRARWTGEWPPSFRNMRPACTRIRLRHYQYRSPPQIERRVRTRITRTQADRFSHEKTSSWVPIGLRQEDLVFPNSAAKESSLWRTRVVKASALHRDEGNDDFQIDWELLPTMGEPQPFLTRVLGRVRAVWRRSLLAGLR
ncbi:MAG: glycosyltransferase family 2 protein [Gemmatimonadetes bacterium]|nr:glycosyltransferase family 2 protein [Gemmatimonadota bacterium]